MLLTVGVVQIEGFQRYIIEDWDNDVTPDTYGGRDSFVAVAAKKLEINFQDLARHINSQFNGVQGEGHYIYHDQIYFYNMEDAIDAKIWLEGQLVAKKLMGKIKGKSKIINFSKGWGSVV
jgi:hypothetical protein